jgi:hypothetical protein
MYLNHLIFIVMGTNNSNTPATPSKRKQELQKTGFNWVEHTREETEHRLPDYCRFRCPKRYMTEEELKYFRSDEQRELFKKMYWPKDDKTN